MTRAAHQENEQTPKAGGAAKGVIGLHSRSGKPAQGNTLGPKGKPEVHFRGPDGTPLTVRGRLAQTLTLLIEKGRQGFTSGDASKFGWARRTSAYIARLRALGLAIETLWETTADGCRIGRYVLAQPVLILKGRG
jgi:hypothetical protein